MLSAVKQIENEAGEINILINNAGFGQYGTIEQTDLEKVKKQFNVNVFGLVRLTQLVLPGMRKTGKGRIINISSTVGDYTLPAAGVYCSTKYAVESISDALRMELRPFGIKVVLIKPGAVNTNFTETAQRLYPQLPENDPYVEINTKFKAMITKQFNPQTSIYGVLSPNQVAKKIVRAAVVKRPKIRYRIGFAAKATPFIKRLLSPKAFDKFILRRLKVSTKLRGRVKRD
jgi:short-subunit dehydrogenase